jgi:hypothetical protein
MHSFYRGGALLLNPLYPERLLETVNDLGIKGYATLPSGFLEPCAEGLPNPKPDLNRLRFRAARHRSSFRRMCLRTS